MDGRRYDGQWLNNKNMEEEFTAGLMEGDMKVSITMD